MGRQGFGTRTRHSLAHASVRHSPFFVASATPSHARECAAHSCCAGAPLGLAGSRMWLASSPRLGRLGLLPQHASPQGCLQARMRASCGREREWSGGAAVAGGGGARHLATCSAAKRKPSGPVFGNDGERVLDRGVWRKFKHCAHCQLIIVEVRGGGDVGTCDATRSGRPPCLTACLHATRSAPSGRTAGRASSTAAIAASVMRRGGGAAATFRSSNPRPCRPEPPHKGLPRFPPCCPLPCCCPPHALAHHVTLSFHS